MFFGYDSKSKNGQMGLFQTKRRSYSEGFNRVKRNLQEGRKYL